MDISCLQPTPVWRHFSNLCQIPHASGQEAALREAIVVWARARGLGVKVDDTGNLVLKKAATPGYENRPGVVLQGHLDMVCQKNGDSAHDFARDPIHAVERDGWVTAGDTTLGADNGIGVALALAALESGAMPHPALEALFTVDEEAGMHGALAARPDTVDGRLLLNLDTEEWGELYIGCAGSVDVMLEAPLPTEPGPAGFAPFSVRLSGLAGGHSGIDIHRGRGNAIKLLGEFLHELGAKDVDFRLAAFAGGTAHNAIAREAEATLLLAPGRVELAAQAGRYADTRRLLLPAEDAGVRLEVAPLAIVPASVLSAADTRRVLALVHEMPYGVRAMSAEMAGVVETSNNVGELRLAGGRLHLNAMVRSLREAGVRNLAAEILYLLNAKGFDHPRVAGAGPVWTPDRTSKLLALAQKVYRDAFGGEATVQVIHAGLECGVFAALWPEMEMISFGPTIQGAHSPGERVDVASVERAWTLLMGILAAIPPA
ncbi:MAG: aminoacyl-histidine dipeptidase [Azoarcus sp.]|jgi:dipeptidase D|nr:aminoacyl-histidine dipeptidase [Azoarcus sp.]